MTGIVPEEETCFILGYAWDGKGKKSLQRHAGELRQLVHERHKKFFQTKWCAPNVDTGRTFHTGKTQMMVETFATTACLDNWISLGNFCVGHDPMEILLYRRREKADASCSDSDCRVPLLFSGGTTSTP